MEEGRNRGQSVYVVGLLVEGKAGGRGRRRPAFSDVSPEPRLRKERSLLR